MRNQFTTIDSPKNAKFTQTLEGEPKLEFTVKVHGGEIQCCQTGEKTDLTAQAISNGKKLAIQGKLCQENGTLFCKIHSVNPV